MPTSALSPLPTSPAERPLAGAAPSDREVFAREARSLVRLAIPIVGSQLGTVGLNTLDTVMVAPLGAEALAAVGLASALHTTGLVICIGALNGMAPLVSQAWGGGQRRRPGRVLVAGCWFSLALSVLLVAVSLAGEWLGLVLGQRQATAAAAGTYLRALAWGVPPVLAFTACRQFLEGMARPRLATAVTFLGLGVNYLGNRLLIPSLGVIGSAWATTAVRWAMFAAVAAALWLQRRPLGLTALGWRPRPHLFGRLVQVGVPAGLQYGLEVAFFSFTALMMGWLGPLAQGTHQIAINLAATTFMVAMGTSIAGSIRVGHNLGAGDPAGARGATLATYGLVTGAMSVFALLFLAVPNWLVGLYSHDPQMLRLGASLLGVAALFQVFDGAQVAGYSVLRGAADTRVPMLMAGVAYWVVGAPAGYALGFTFGLGPVGIWLGMVLALGVAAALLGWRVWQVLWRRTPTLP